MHSGTIKYALKQIVGWMLLLQMVNISIDPPDFKLLLSSTGYRSLALNDTESVYEMIAEDLLDQNIPEGNENDIEKTMHSFLLFCHKPPVYTLEVELVNSNYRVASKSETLIRYYKPASPPPKFFV